jgi:hypothetical protein
MSRRDALVRGGFAFEYSATFGQAVAKGLTVAAAEEDMQKKRAKMLFETSSLKKLTAFELSRLALTTEDKRRARVTATREIYAKCILFDYSYKFFYEDGYGKESLILNMSGEAYEQADNARKYFTACLLGFYQQLWLWSTHRDKLTDFNIEKPLWVFVGNTVSGEESDILEVVSFLADFLNHDAQIKTWLADLIADRAQLLDAKGNNIFKGRFTPLMGFADDVGALYDDILQRVFNAPARQRLKLVNIKNSKGELALRVGDAEPFGLINIGDDAAFFKLADAATAFDNETDDFRRCAVWHAQPKGQPAPGVDRFTQVHRRLEQLARFHHGPVEHGPGRRLANHSVVWAWCAPEGQGVFAQADNASGKTQGHAPGQAGNAEHFWCARQLHGHLQGIPAGRGRHAKRRNSGAGLSDPRQPARWQAENAGAEGWLQGQPKAWLQAHAFPHAVRNPGSVQGQDQAPACAA